MKDKIQKAPTVSKTLRIVSIAAGIIGSMPLHVSMWWGFSDSIDFPLGVGCGLVSLLLGGIIGNWIYLKSKKPGFITLVLALLGRFVAGSVLAFIEIAFLQ